MEDIVKSLKELSLEILQAEKRNTNEWLKAVSNLHEQLLILKYLDDRKQQLESIENGQGNFVIAHEINFKRSPVVMPRN